jgi:N6-adenosine-specific RNA methylase IME4
VLAFHSVLKPEILAGFAEVFMAVRNIGTHFTAPKTHHSAKPDVFYQMVERTSYPLYLDVFAQKRRPGWTVWGNGIAEAAEAHYGRLRAGGF